MEPPFEFDYVRTELVLIDEIASWGFAIDRVSDTRSDEHGFVVTRAVSLAPT